MGGMPDIIACVLYYLDARSLAHIRSVSRLYDISVQAEWSRRVCLHTQPFVTRIKAFYVFLGSMECVVSGSVALAVLLTASSYDGFLEDTSDLDV